MRKILLSLVVAVAVASLPATDDFNRNASTLGSNWTATTAAITDWTLNTVTRLSSTYGGADFASAYWNADSFTAAHYAQAVITKGALGYEGVGVRLDNAGNGYVGVLDPCHIYKFTAGTRSTLLTCSLSWTNGHTFKMTATGTSTTTLTLYDNGASVDSIADSSSPHTAGAPGLVGYVDTGAITTDWEGNNIGGVTSFVPGIINAPIRGGGLRAR